MVVMTVTLAMAAAEVEAPRDLSHSRRDHLGGAPDAGRDPPLAPMAMAPQGLAVHLGEVEVRVVGEEVVAVPVPVAVVPGRGEARGRVEESLAEKLLPLLQDQPAGAFPCQLYL